MKKNKSSGYYNTRAKLVNHKPFKTKSELAKVTSIKNNSLPVFLILHPEHSA